MTHEFSKQELIEMGRAELRAAHGLTNLSRVSDEFLVDQIREIESEVYDEIGYEPDDIQPGSPAYNAVRYYGLIRAAYIFDTERGPTSISHARRFDYGGDQQLHFWRDRMIRALSKL